MPVMGCQIILQAHGRIEVKVSSRATMAHRLWSLQTCRRPFSMTGAFFPNIWRTAADNQVFHLSAAKTLLRADVEDGKHLRMKPLQLKMTRNKYSKLSNKMFKHWIYQEVCQQKFINYLKLNRAKREQEVH